MSDTPLQSPPAEAMKEPTAEEKRQAEVKAGQEAAMKLAAELNAKTQARIAVLKTYEGKTFKRKDGPNPFQTIRIVRYEGIGKLNDGKGTLAHLFRVESKNPGAIWTPPATQFLEEYEEVQPEETATNNQEPI